MEIEQIKKITQKIQGWLTEKEGMLLYNLAKEANGTIIEIGSWQGRSTIWLGKGSLSGNKNKIYAIDPHTGASEHRRMFGENIWTFDTFQENIKNASIDSIVITIIKTSEEAFSEFKEDKQIGLVFVDGAHEYHHTKQDFQLWSTKIKDGGIIAFHDCKKKGVKKALKEVFYCSNKFVDLQNVDSIMYARKVENNSIADRIKNKSVPIKREIKRNINKFKKSLKKRLSVFGCKNEPTRRKKTA
jgi:predicted O-methyltransferase YrrM